MKVVILCGGRGTRLREETEFRPKPMVPIGRQPVLWHIMKYYASFGHKDFILCLGYKGEVIKEYFRNYHWNTSDVTLRLGRVPRLTYHGRHDEEDWNVTLLDTGQQTMTGGRLRRALDHVDADPFLLTYGDGLTDSPINDSIAFHRAHGGIATLTAVQPEGRFGELALDGTRVDAFSEKPDRERGWVNGGFFVMDRRIGKYLTGDDCILERAALSTLAREGQVQAYKHEGFWQCMDTYREQLMLTEMWETGRAPWKIW